MPGKEKVKQLPIKVTHVRKRALLGKTIEYSGKSNIIRNRQVNFRDIGGELKKIQAYGDYIFWLNHVNKDIKLLTASLDGLRVPLANRQKSISSYNNIERYTDLLFSDADHLYKTLSSDIFSKDLKLDLKPHLETEVRAAVHHLRNLREHWEDNRKFFEGDKTKKPKPSAIWFQKNMLVTKLFSPSPWSIVFLPNQEPYLAGIFQIKNLTVELDNISKVMSYHVKSHKSIIGNRRVTY